MRRIFSLRILGASILFGVAVIAAAVPAPKAGALSGSGFSAARIVDDSTFFNSNTMSPTDIQVFLNSKVPACRSGYTCLKDYTQAHGTKAADAYCGGIVGGTKSAATIIYEASRACNINPQTILVMLEKEQSLVTDDFPVDIQYRSAMGFGCPDTAACDSQYYGFFNQVYNGARQMKRYVQLPQQFNHAAGRTSFIQYNPNSACGGSNVTIHNGATAALYNYTPYQPNAATLAAAPGQTVNCGAYGNINFWRIFNKWFGPTTGDGYVVAIANNGDTRQWLIQGGKKFLIPSPEIIRAWGLSTPNTYPGTYLGSFPDGPAISRLMRPPGTPDVYFVDNGNCYRVPSTEMLAAWNLNPAAIFDAGAALSRLPANQGNLAYSVRKSGSLAVYLMDNGSVKQYSNPDVLTSWEGDSPKIIDLSGDYSSAVGPDGSVITSAKAKNASSDTQYNVVAGQKLPLSSGVSLLYPGAPTVVSDVTLNRLVISQVATHFVKGVSSPTVYLVDGAVKHAIPSQEILRAWGVGANPTVNVVSQGNLNMLSTGVPISGYEADVGGQLYIMDGRKITVPSNLDSAYRTGSVYSASAALMAILPNGETASNFLRGSQNLPIYLMDGGSIRHIRTPQDMTFWNNGETVRSVSDYVLSQFPHGGYIGSYVSSGGVNYALDSGTKYSVSAAAATNWNFNSPDAVASSTIARFPGSIALGNGASSGSAYYLIRNMKSHITFNADLAGLWGVTSTPGLSAAFMQRTTSDIPLTIFVRSTDPGDQRIFIADNGGTQLYHLTTPEQVYNYGYQNGGQMLKLSPSEITAGNPVTAKNLIKKSSGGEAVLDSGAKRLFSNPTVAGKWMTDSNISTVSDSLWAFIPAASNINATVKASAPNVYTIESGQKRWVQSQSTYQNLYAPYQTIGSFLNTLLPSGPNIP